VLSDALAQRRLQSSLFVGFAAVALLLAAVGLFGVLSQNVVQREREFGLRVALGASARDVLGLVVFDALRLVALGSVLGVLGYLGLARAPALRCRGQRRRHDRGGHRAPRAGGAPGLGASGVARGPRRPRDGPAPGVIGERYRS
jgi:hypothetical protein